MQSLPAPPTCRARDPVRDAGPSGAGGAVSLQQALRTGFHATSWGSSVSPSAPRAQPSPIATLAWLGGLGFHRGQFQGPSHSRQTLPQLKPPPRDPHHKASGGAQGRLGRGGVCLGPGHRSQGRGRGQRAAPPWSPAGELGDPGPCTTPVRRRGCPRSPPPALGGRTTGCRAT